MTYEVLALAAIGVAALVFVYIRDQRLTMAHRRRAFENCRGLLDGAELEIRRGDYPTLRGRKSGRAVEIRLLADNINVRKLPVLWMIVTVHAPLSLGGMLVMMMRPQNTEYFSAFDRMPERMATPPDWPEQAVLRGRDLSQMQAIAAQLQNHIGLFHNNPTAKELVVGPGGVRMTLMADQAVRAQYLTLRQAVFARDILARELVSDALDATMAIVDEFLSGKPVAQAS